MNTLLWVMQSVLALAFLAHGLVFTFPPEAIRKIKKQSPLPAGFMGSIYAAESLGAERAQQLRDALGLMPIAAGAAVLHASRREVPPAIFTAVLFALAAFVACARLFVAPL